MEIDVKRNGSRVDIALTSSTSPTRTCGWASLSPTSARELAEKLIAATPKAKRGYQVRNLKGDVRYEPGEPCPAFDNTAVRIGNTTALIGGTLGAAGILTGHYIQPVMYDPETLEVLRDGWE